MFDARTFRLDGEIALITGAGAGIGRAIAELFASAGAAVVVSDLKREAAEAVAAGITQAGGRAAGIACNVTLEEDLQRAVATAQAQFGGLTVLVNNAGGGGAEAGRHADGRFPLRLRPQRLLSVSFDAARHAADGTGRPWRRAQHLVHGG